MIFTLKKDIKVLQPMCNPATNLDDAYQQCNPDKPLPADDGRYVDLADIRGETLGIARRTTRRIKRSAEGDYLQLLFTGHRGSGKSTELFRLKAELENENYFVVYLDVEDVLDLVEINYLDVLLAIAKETESALRKKGLKLPQTLLDNIAEWFAEKILEEDQKTEFKAGLETTAEVEGGIPFFAKLMARTTSEIKAASSRRISTRQKLEREFSVFIEKLNVLINAARQQVKNNDSQDLVLIIDGLEKMHYTVNGDGISSHAALFVQHAEQLKAPNCHIIYTVPISLAHNANLGNDFDETIILPMVQTSDEGIKKLYEVIAQRVNIDKVFASAELVNKIARLSGGVMRDLMRLIRLSTDTDDDQISQSDVDYACKTLIREYDRLVRNDDIESLRRIKKNRRAQADESDARLLNLRLVLEYQNGHRWADLHPALERISWLKEELDKDLSDSSPQ